MSKIITYWKRVYYKRKYYKKTAWVQPKLTSNTSYGIVTATEPDDGIYSPWKALDGIKEGASFWRPYDETLRKMFLQWDLPVTIYVKSIYFYNRTHNDAYPEKVTAQFFTDSSKKQAITDSFSTPSGSFKQTVVPALDTVNGIETNCIYIDMTTNKFGGIGELEIIADILSDGTSSDYDYYEDIVATESDYDYYEDIRVTADDDWTYTTEVEVLQGHKGANLIHGLYHFGRYIHAGNTLKSDGGGGGILPDDNINYLPDVFTVIAYNDDGTKTAIFGAGSESNSLKQLTFEVVETGCGKVELTFNKLPANAELSYRQRVDIHLFNDSRPWYSGYIISRPIEGTTQDKNFKFTGHGYYNLLEKVIINSTYENQEVSAIVSDISRQIERKIGLTTNPNKIINTGYTITKIILDHVTAKEALKQLSDFAIDYVYGVDEYRQLYFQPRDTEINEQARLWVGQHIDSYVPEWDVEDIVNHAYIKGGNVDDEGEQWLAELEDAESQKLYKIQEDVWTLPSAYDVADAERWGESQLTNLAYPKKSAKVSGVKLEYPRADGTFFVRKLSTQGQAAITTAEGELYTYPISKLKYTVSSDKGIQLDMELGDIPDAIDRYFANLDRDAKMAELLQQAATKQLKTGG